ncbi:ABC transporter ATP-binding protein [Chelativorans sp. AA-79]|uniref:ABC transporter ATP-binding protein n=1 Tax=Chelativorans sp. AA-79 TaxID=3028735 RepID=UPI0023F7151C|nr:ABC transporter ATP-binding protein [Chelativorans sp. AA-79]WEX08660.1 ABC transporter ATP-binding protein [Chelativorans sp. AA-79]
MLSDHMRAATPPASILEVRDLVLASRKTGAILVNGMSFTLNAGEILALVGESGSGKSLTALAVLGLLPAGVEQRGGRVLVDGQDVTGLLAAQRLRGSVLAAIFQDPQASLDPRWNVERFLVDRFMRLRAMEKRVARAAAADILHQVGLHNPARVLRAYPHELSGGMAQRVMIAGALAGGPRILIADEPTTALDVTTQAQILDLIRDIQARTGLGIMMITHDLGVVAEISCRVMVLYGGRLMEQGNTAEVLEAPMHPYTSALLAAMPDIDKDDPPVPIRQARSDEVSASGCPFAPRCKRVLASCHMVMPGPTLVRNGRSYACHTRVEPLMKQATKLLRAHA